MSTSPIVRIELAGKYAVRIGRDVIGSKTNLQRQVLVVETDPCPIRIIRSSASTIKAVDGIPLVYQAEVAANAEVTAFEIRVASFDLFNRFEREMIRPMPVMLSVGQRFDVDIGEEALAQESLWSLSFAFYISHARLSNGTVWSAEPDQVARALQNVGLSTP